jgi:DUF4097 and DUF4098 domain-containing protein YvlB
MKRFLLRPVVLAVPVLAILAASSLAVAETTIDKQLTLDSGGKFVLDAAAGSVRLTGTSGSGAHVVVTSSDSDMKEKYDFKFDETPGVVRVTVKKKGSWTSGWFSSGDKAPKFQIEVPERTTLDIQTGGGSIEVTRIQGEANVETSGGHIQVSDLKGRLVAETSGGHIKLRDIDGDAKIETSGGHIDVGSLKGSLHAETSGGHMEINDVSGDIDASTSGGHISISGAGGKVDAETSGGSVKVEFAKGNTHGGKIESSGGGITVAVDPGANLAVDAETSDGTVSTDLSISGAGSGGGERSRSSLRGSLGKGGETLRLRTSAGSIHIESN